MRHPGAKLGETKMGMDVYGHNPTASVGVTTLCPDEASPCDGWHYNEGDGLDAIGAAALAAKLEKCRASGDVTAYCAQRDAYQAALPPRVECAFCGGTGRDSDAPAGPPNDLVEVAIMALATAHAGAGCDSDGRPCRVCGGAGTVENWAKAYSLDPSDVDAFIAFLRASGGFAIW
jgi:hypothetical protein